jgi:hypothetical protein
MRRVMRDKLQRNCAAQHRVATFVYFARSAASDRLQNLEAPDPFPELRPFRTVVLNSFRKLGFSGH